MVFLDVETTGLDAKKDRVIEVGLVKINKDGQIESFSQLINPGFKISKEIRELTGIKYKELANAPFFDDIQAKLTELLKVDLFIAHNAKFDYDFITEEFGRLKSQIALPYIDTIKLAKTFYPNYLTYNLDSIITRLKLNVEKRHRALDDSQVLVKLYQRIMKEFGEDELHKTIDKYLVLPKAKQVIDTTQASLF